MKLAEKNTSTPVKKSSSTSKATAPRAFKRPTRTASLPKRSDRTSLSKEKAAPQSSRVSNILRGLGESFGATPAKSGAKSRKSEGGGFFGGVFDRIKEAAKEARKRPEDPQAGAIHDALGSDDPVNFENSRGENFDLGVERVGTEDGVTSYDLELDGEVVEVKLEGDLDHRQILGNVADYYSEIPEHLRGALDEVVFREEDFEQENFDGRVPSNSGRIEFDTGAVRSNGDLSRNLFHHEFGHVLGNHLEDRDDSGWENFRERFTGERGPARPDGFQEAYEADRSPDIPGNSAGSNALNEEFADGWQTYLEARLNGGDRLSDFEEQFPNLAAHYAEIYNG